MSDLTSEELALLAAEDGGAAKRPRIKRRHEDKPVEDEPVEPVEPVAVAVAATPARGPITPAQWDDDGWGDTPVQMRG